MKVIFHPGEHIYRRLHFPKGSSNKDSASGVYAVSLQQWPQAEGVWLLQEGDSPGTVKDVKISTKKNCCVLLCTF